MLAAFAHRGNNLRIEYGFCHCNAYLRIGRRYALAGRVSHNVGRREYRAVAAWSAFSGHVTRTICQEDILASFSTESGLAVLLLILLPAISSLSAFENTRPRGISGYFCLVGHSRFIRWHSASDQQP